VCERGGGEKVTPSSSAQGCTRRPIQQPCCPRPRAAVPCFSQVFHLPQITRKPDASARTNMSHYKPAVRGARKTRVQRNRADSGRSERCLLDVIRQCLTYRDRSDRRRGARLASHPPQPSSLKALSMALARRGSLSTTGRSSQWRT